MLLAGVTRARSAHVCSAQSMLHEYDNETSPDNSATKARNNYTLIARQRS